MCNSAAARRDDAAGAGGAAAAAAARAEGAEAVVPAAVLEEDLTREVPELLEVMNRAAEDVNRFERKVSEAQVRYKQRLEHWSRLYNDLRKQCGSDFDRVKPYFDAAQVLNATACRMQSVVCEFTTVASRCSQAKAELQSMEKHLVASAGKGTPDLELQNSLSRAAARLLEYQQERDWRQEEHESALRIFREAQDAFTAYGSQLPDSTIKCTFPCFRLLRQHQLRLSLEQNRINTLLEGTRDAKQLYNQSLRELERISAAVHQLRRERAKEAKAAESTEC